MNNFLITNEAEAKDFSNRVDAYWIDRSTRYESSQELYRYYLIPNNYPFIDTQKNNGRSFGIALSMGNVEFLDLLINSKNLTQKNYLLKDISGTLSRNSHTEFECVKLIINAFKDQKEIFGDYSPKIKKLFIKSCAEYFINLGICEENDKKEYFFNYIKENKINLYKNPYDLVELLMHAGRIKTLNTLVDQAKSIEDKNSILYLNTKYSMDLEHVQEFLEFKRKEVETLEKYKKLTLELNTSTENKKGKKPKI